MLRNKRRKFNLAKSLFGTKFSKSTISKENNKYIVTEVTKDSCLSYDLSAVLDSLIGIENLAISFGSDVELKPLELQEDDTVEE
jgi:hypothetical protein